MALDRFTNQIACGVFNHHLSRCLEQANNEQGRNFGPASEKHIAISKKLDALAKTKKTQITSVALAYVRHKYPYVFPIVGGRKIEHLKGNIEALGLELSEDEVKDIDSAVPFDVGFPMSFLFEMGGGTYDNTMTSSDVFLLQFSGKLDSLPIQGGAKARKLEEEGSN